MKAQRFFLLWCFVVMPAISSYAQEVWTCRNPLPTSNHLLGVVNTGTQFVAVGQAGVILTSPNGVDWTTRKSGTTIPLYSVTWTGTQLVSGGYGGDFFTSPDGITWTTRKTGTTNY